MLTACHLKRGNTYNIQLCQWIRHSLEQTDMWLMEWVCEAVSTLQNILALIVVDATVGVDTTLADFVGSVFTLRL